MQGPGAVLVTGGSGYLGAVLVPLLRAAGWDVVVLDPAVGPARSEPGLRLDHGSVEDPDSRARALDGVSHVVHLAALSSERACSAHPERAVALNVDATARLAEEAAQRHVTRFVLASTCAVYGDTGGRPVDETAVVAPGATYARSKAAAEVAVRCALADAATVLRFGTLYGDSPSPAPALPLHTMVRDAVSTGVITLAGGGLQWRAMVHVADAAEAILAVLDQPSAAPVAGAVLDVADPAADSRMADLARLVADIAGARVERTRGEPDCRSYRVRSAAIRTCTRWTPRRSLPTTVEELVVAERRRATAPAALGDELAIDGGRAVRQTALALALPHLGPEEEEEVVATLRSGWLSSGPRTRQFERDLAASTGATHAVAVSSCTAALHLSLAALGVGPGDEVVVPAVTWPSTANVVVHLGARPVIVDVDPSTLCMDPAALRSALGDKTRAVIAVHLAGHPARMDDIWDLAEGRGLPVVEDAAHALGATYRGRPVGASPRSATACLSFYPTKNLTTGEGGAVLTSDAGLAAHIRLLANNGVTRGAWERHGPDAQLHWEAVLPGYKAAMADLQAAIGIHQLRRLPGFLKRREQIARRYNEAFSSCGALAPLGEAEDVTHAWHLYVVRLCLEHLTVGRDAFAAALRAEGIHTGVHFRSLHVQPWFRDTYDLDADRLPAAQSATERILSLPLFPAMSDRDVGDVVAAVLKVAAHYRSAAPSLSVAAEQVSDAAC